MSKRSVTIIIGAHGSGKSTLVRNIIGPNTEIKSAMYSKYTVSEIPCNGIERIDNNIIYNTARTRRVAAVGTYLTNCGGCDSVRRLAFSFQTMEHIIENEPETNVVMEGIILSNVFNTPLKNVLRAKYDHGMDVEICLLYVSQQKSYERVKRRNNGKDVKLNLIRDKQRGALRVYKHWISTNEFRCKAIDTTGLNGQQVFEQFSKWSLIYK